MTTETLDRSKTKKKPAGEKIKDLKILIVDDERYICDLLTDLLKEQAREIESAADGEEALKKLSLKHFNVVVTDVKMPRMDGFTLLKNVKQAHPDTAVVVITAYSQDYSIREALALGAEEYLPKPFRSEEVLMVIERAYWRNQARRTSEHPLPTL